MDEPMTLIERLRNPAWEINPNGGDALLNIGQTRAAMDEAADLIAQRVIVTAATRRAREKKPREPYAAPFDEEVVAHALLTAMEALRVCAAGWSSPPCTVAEGFDHLYREFVRRAEIAAEAVAKITQVVSTRGEAHT